MLERFICAIFKHKYIVEKQLSISSRKIGCTRCDRKWVMNDDVKALLPWDSDFESLCTLRKESK
jgi:hypothetical protein